MDSRDSNLRQLEQAAEKLFALLTVRRVLCLLIVILFFTAWNTGIALIYVLLFFLLALLLVSWGISIAQVRPLQAHRQYPAVVHAGETFSLHYTVENRSRFTRHLVEVADSLPFVIDRDQSPVLVIPSIRQTTTITLQTVADWRGDHALGALTLRSRWPFGLFASEKTLAATGSRILVYPSTFPLRSLPLTGASQSQQDGWTTDARKGGQDVFIGIRDYRRGDSLRHVHWALSARHGELVVREFENIHRTEICICLNLHAQQNPGTGKHKPLEYAIQIAASVAEYALRAGYPVSLYGEGSTPLTLEAGSGLAMLDKILYVLAHVQADGNADYTALLQREINRHGTRCQYLLFDHNSNSLRAASVGLDQSAAMLVRFDARTFQQMLPEKIPASRDGSLMIRCGDDLADKVNAWTVR
jgi:uncharacterized protein (DUF58 family)